MPLPVGRDLERTRRALLDWLPTKLPDARDLRIAELTAPERTGFSNDTLLFDLEWHEAGERRREGLVVRIKPSGFPVFPSYDVGKQYRVMKILGERSDVPVPKMYWLEEDESMLGAPFYVMGRIDGQIPSDNPPYHAVGWMTELPTAGRATLWWSGLEAMARIHRLDSRALGLDFLALPELGAAPLEQHLSYYERYLEWAARGRRQPTAEPALDWLKSNVPRSEPTGLSWGDSRIGNQIFRSCRCVAVLDWEMAMIGNPEQDLAWWLFVDRSLSEGIGLPRLDGLPSREETVARYQELVGRKVENLHYYEVWAGFRFAVIMCRIAQQQVEYGVMPPDSDFETNNMVTQLLARLLDLPAPGQA